MMSPLGFLMGRPDGWRGIIPHLELIHTLVGDTLFFPHLQFPCIPWKPIHTVLCKRHSFRLLLFLWMVSKSFGNGGGQEAFARLRQLFSTIGYTEILLKGRDGTGETTVVVGADKGQNVPTLAGREVIEDLILSIDGEGGVFSSLRGRDPTILRRSARSGGTVLGNIVHDVCLLDEFRYLHAVPPPI